MTRKKASAPRTVLITGASSGIGRALAEAYAAPGVHLALVGRDEARLAAVADVCTLAGAAATVVVLDVTDRAATARRVRELEAAMPLDLVIANAGISGTGRGEGEMERARRILDVNLAGTLNTIEPALEGMTARGAGHLALMSSLAGFRGFASAPAYCASKAAVRVLGEGLRGRLAPSGIAVSVICPGFVRTPLTADNPFPMPLLVEPERAALLIKRGLERRRARIAFPWRLYALTRLAAALPPGLVDRWTARLPAKE